MTTQTFFYQSIETGSLLPRIGTTYGRAKTMRAAQVGSVGREIRQAIGHWLHDHLLPGAGLPTGVHHA